MEGQGNLPPQISAEAEQLIHAVDIALSPAVSTEERNQAYNVCERFKEESPLCAIVGLQLAASARSPTIRHFGLQLVEHCIKFRWKDMHPQEKLSIKVLYFIFFKRKLLIYSFVIGFCLETYGKWHRHE